MRQTPLAVLVRGLLGVVLAVGLGGCTDGGDDPGAEPVPGPSSTPAAGAGEAGDDADLLAFTAEDRGRSRTQIECATFLDADPGPGARVVLWARVEAEQRLRLEELRLRASSIPPGDSVQITTTVAPDPGPVAPDYGVSRDSVPGTAFLDPAREDLGDPTSPDGRAAAGSAWAERRPAAGAVLEPGTHYVFIDVDARRGFELYRPGLAWSVPGEDVRGTAILPRILRGRVICGA